MTETQPTISSDSQDSAVPYRAIRQRWSEIVNSDRKHELGASSFLFYMALMGRDWRKAFTPIQRASKLANGARPYQKASLALAWVKSRHSDARWLELFDGLLTAETLEVLRARLPKVTAEMVEHLPDAPYMEVSDAASSN